MEQHQKMKEYPYSVKAQYLIIKEIVQWKVNYSFYTGKLINTEQCYIQKIDINMPQHYKCSGTGCFFKR